MPATVNLKNFQRSIAIMRQVPGKHGPDVLNKSLAKIAIGSSNGHGVVQRTEKATAERIREDLKKPGPDGTPLLIYLAVIGLKRAGIKPATAWNDGKKGGKRNAARGVSEWNKLVKEKARRILAARLRSKGFIVASWLHALNNLRIKAPAAVRNVGTGGAQLRTDGTAALSYSHAATPTSLRAALFSTAEGADIVSNDSIIQAAVDAATEDNAIYLRRKFGAAIDDAIAGKTNSQIHF